MNNFHYAVSNAELLSNIELLIQDEVFYITYSLQLATSNPFIYGSFPSPLGTHFPSILPFSRKHSQTSVLSNKVSVSLSPP